MNSSPPKRLTLAPSPAKCGEPFGDRIDQAVADGMAERVVDALEVIQVKDRQAAEPIRIAGLPWTPPTIS